MPLDLGGPIGSRCGRTITDRIPERESNRADRPGMGHSTVSTDSTQRDREAGAYVGAIGVDSGFRTVNVVVMEPHGEGTSSEGSRPFSSTAEPDVRVFPSTRSHEFGPDPSPCLALSSERQPDLPPESISDKGVSQGWCVTGRNGQLDGSPSSPAICAETPSITPNGCILIVTAVAVDFHGQSCSAAQSGLPRSEESILAARGRTVGGKRPSSKGEESRGVATADCGQSKRSLVQVEAGQPGRVVLESVAL